MEIHTGIGVGPGYAIGPVVVVRPDVGHVPLREIPKSALTAEIERIAAAFETAQAQLVELSRSAGGSEEVEAILAGHGMMLADPALRDSVEQRCRDELVSAENAVADTFDAVAARFESLPDPYFRQRATDVRDIQKRLLMALRGDGLERVGKGSPEGVVLAANELTPSQTAGLDRRRTVGFLTDRGGPTSHTAIVARSLGIPAVVGLGDVVSRLADGQTVVVDGIRGEVVVDPDEGQLERYREAAKRHQRYVRELSKIRDFPAETRDGHAIRLQGNIELPSELDEVVKSGAEGVGLFRTEFLYDPAKPPPTEEDHYAVYVSALRKLGGKSLTIRTFDFGADKATPDEAASREANPALGLRSIRLCLERPQLFLPQLRAILRASEHGPVRILFPMISGVGELLRARELLEKARASLRSEGFSGGDGVPVGVMVEIPSAAVLADILVDEVDFLSIGSNDLIQYTLAVDRVNARVANLYEPAHPAMLRLLQGIVRSAAEKGKSVSLCGEMAGDRLYTVLLVGMGLRDLSISARALPEIKQAIRSITVEQAREAAAWCMSARTGPEARSRLREVMTEHLRD